MLLEFLESVFTPCPRFARVMGYLREVVGIGARYRRCKEDWQPHLDHSREIIRRAVAQCAKRRKAVVLGSGRLYDVPVEELSAQFERVALVDLIHPLPARRRCRRLANVAFVTADVTGVLEPLQNIAYAGGILPVSRPTMFLDDADVDLVISLNILSQLPIIPCRYLRRWNQFNEHAIERFRRQLTQAHVDYLQLFRGRVCLIADLAFLTVDAEERVIKEVDALREISLPCLGEEWIWRLAPREKRRKTGSYHRVRGMVSAKPRSELPQPLSAEGGS
jgi:hypothetical protein